jgi:fatty acid desaturase
MSKNDVSRPVENENGLASSLAIFAIMIALFFGAIYSLSFLSLENPWPMAVCLGLFGLAFWIPQTILGRSDSAGES